MDYRRHLLMILSVLEDEEFDKFLSNYSFDTTQDKYDLTREVLAFCVEIGGNSLTEVINDIELNSPSLNWDAE